VPVDGGVTPSIALLAFITLQRLGELVLAERNTRRLKAQDAYEVGREHYPLIVVLHAAWLAGLWLLGWNRPVNPWFLGAFAAVEALRVWTLVSLGERWTTRIIVLPSAPLVRRGPYRFMSHPNYLVVVLEIALAPLALGLLTYAAVFSLLNNAVLIIRVRAENAALAEITPPP
jgi:methyltransferase